MTSITYSNGLLRYKGSDLIISGITIASGNTQTLRRRTIVRLVARVMR